MHVEISGRTNSETTGSLCVCRIDWFHLYETSDAIQRLSYHHVVVASIEMKSIEQCLAV